MGLAHDDIIGVYIVHRNARLIQGVDQPRLADDIGRAARHLVMQEFRSGKRARVKMVLADVDAQALQLLLELPR